MEVFIMGLFLILFLAMPIIGLVAGFKELNSNNTRSYSIKKVIIVSGNIRKKASSVATRDIVGGAVFGLIGESLNMIGQSLKTKEYALQELDETIIDELASVSFNTKQLRNSILKGHNDDQLEHEIYKDLERINVLKQQRDDLQKDISHDQRLNEMKQENREASIYDRNKKIKSNELYDYLWDIVQSAIDYLQRNTEYKLIFKLLKMQENIKSCYHDYKIDYNNYVVGVWADYPDFSKVYLQVVRDVQKTYQGNIEIEKENERIRKLNKKIKRENRFIIAGMLTAFSKFADKVNKGGRR